MLCCVVFCCVMFCYNLCCVVFVMLCSVGLCYASLRHSMLRYVTLRYIFAVLNGLILILHNPEARVILYTFQLYCIPFNQWTF